MNPQQSARRILERNADPNKLLRAQDECAGMLAVIERLHTQNPRAARELFSALRDEVEVGSVRLSFRDGALHSVTVERVTY